MSLSAAMAAGSDPEAEEEAICQKTLAESNFRNSNLKLALSHAQKALRLSPNTEGLSSMVTAFEIISSAADSSAGDSMDWYKILQVEPFSHTNTIKQRYRKLALVLHPDKNPYVGCEEAFKLVNEAFRVFSDRIRKKEYDMKLRIRIQEERVSTIECGGNGGDDEKSKSTFWTACSGCRLLHKFDRKYLGHNLMCPKCKKSFEAKEIGEEEEGKDGDDTPKIITYKRRKTSNGGGDCGGLTRTNNIREINEQKAEASNELGRSGEEESEEGDEGMTLAQLHSRIKRNRAKMKSKIDEKEAKLGSCTQEKSSIDATVSETPLISKEMNVNKKGKASKNEKNRKVFTEIVDLRVSRKRNRDIFSQESETEMMLMEESDLYDFVKDMTLRSFKKGQVWSVYNDDEDRLRRRYCLIDKVISLNPFKVLISWLDSENNKLISWAKTRSRPPFGMFRVSEKSLVKQLKIFSHVVECERVAREVYRIYPRKGSVWAVNTETSSVSRRGDAIAVCLTMYSDMYGLSLAYLEKVEGYTSLFKRREFGSKAIRLVEKDDVSAVLSHQIPARKLPENQSPDGLKDCWVLDPCYC